MTKREFNLSLMPGVEQPLKEAKLALFRVDEVLFQEWAKQFDRLPESMLRELWTIQNKRNINARPKVI